MEKIPNPAPEYEADLPIPDGEHLNEKQRFQLRQVLVLIGALGADTGIGSVASKAYSEYKSDKMSAVFAATTEKSSLNTFTGDDETISVPETGEVFITAELPDNNESVAEVEKIGEVEVRQADTETIRPMPRPEPIPKPEVVAETAPSKSIRPEARPDDNLVEVAGTADETVTEASLPETESEVVAQGEEAIQTSDLEKIRPVQRPEFTIKIDQTQYESLPEGSRKFLTDVYTHQQLIAMPNGALAINSDGEAVAVIPAGIIWGENPGAGFNKTGHVSEGYSVDWKTKARETAARESGVNPVNLDLAYNWKEINSAAKKLGFYPESMLAATTQFANMEVPESGGLSRIKYLQENLVINNPDNPNYQEMPEGLKAIVRALALGIPAEESRFDETVVSEAGACTTFQFLERTWEGLGYPPIDTYPNGIPPYELQVEAFGKHLSNIYTELHTKTTTAHLNQIKDLFASEEDYFRYFLGPTIIGAHNWGVGTARAATEKFVNSDEFKELQASSAQQFGYDVFDTLIDQAEASDEGALASFKVWSAAYPKSVLAFSLALHKEYGIDPQELLVGL